MSGTQIISVLISALAVIVSLCAFIVGRRDKTTKDIQEQQQQSDSHILMDYRLKKIEEQLEKISNKLDWFDKDIDTRVEKALKLHVSQYHQK